MYKHLINEKLMHFSGKQMYLDDKAQISAEMILLMGGLIILVIVVGLIVLNVANSVAGNVTSVVNTARDTTINRLWVFHYTNFFEVELY